MSRTGVAVMISGALVWTAAIWRVAVWRHEQFLSHRFDLGNMVQAVWSTAHGRPLEVTSGQTGEQMVRLGSHVDPVLVLYAPFWWLHPDVETLILVQAAAFAAGIYPVVRLARKYSGSALVTALLGAWYFVLPWVVWLALNELNPLNLVLPLLLYAIWFLDEHRLGLFGVFATLALLSGELVGLTVAALGIWYALRYRRPRVGLGIAEAGFVWTAVCLAVVVPVFRGGRSSQFYERFASVGGSPIGVAQTLVTDPGAVFAQLATVSDLQYLVLLAAPAAFLFLGQPLLLLAAAPQLGVNMFSDFAAMHSPLYHYAAAIVAVLIAASIMAIGRLDGLIRLAAAATPLAISIAMLVLVLPVPGAEQYLFPSRETSARRAAMREALELVPAGAPVTATNRLGAHLSERRVIQLFPEQAKATWAVIDTQDRTNDGHWVSASSFERRLERLVNDPAWTLEFANEGVFVYRRAGRADPTTEPAPEDAR